MMVSTSPFCMLLCYIGLCFVGTASAAWTSKTKADLAVIGLETLVPAFDSFEGDMYAGLLPIAHPSKDQGEEGEYMFWLFEPEAPAVDDTLIIWFNGGPGCTSFSAGVSNEKDFFVEWHLIFVGVLGVLTVKHSTLSCRIYGVALALMTPSSPISTHNLLC